MSRKEGFRQYREGLKYQRHSEGDERKAEFKRKDELDAQIKRWKAEQYGLDFSKFVCLK